MNSERQEKLERLKKNKAARNTVIVTSTEPFAKAIEEKIDLLKDTLGGGVQITNLDDLLSQLEALQSFQHEVKELRESIKILEIPSEITVTGLDSLIDATKIISERKDKDIIIEKTDFTSVIKAIDKLSAKVIAQKVPAQGQSPNDYVPMRRVVKIDGMGLVYDDSFYTGGGGGGSTNNGIINGANGGSATVTGGKLDVNATASLAGQAIPSVGATTAVTTQLVDGSGNQITSFGGGTQYTEDVAAAADPVGTATILVRKDTPAALTTTDGDNVAQRATNYGAAYTQVVTSAGAFVDTFGGGTQFADGAARGTATGTLVMGDDGTLIQSITAKTLNTQVVGGDTGLVVNAALHGLTTAGGGSYVDVKVNPSGAVTTDASGSTLGANSGVDIGDVTINNAAGGSAVNIQDGGNSITIDGSLTNISGTVSLPTGAATETTLIAIKDTTGIKKITDALPAGTNLLGKVSIDQVTANANEVVTKTGSITTATLNAETTKVIGTVNVAASQTIATTNAGTFAVQDSQVVADDAAFTVGTTKVQPAGFFANETATDSVNEGDAGAARMTLDRKMIVLYSHIPQVD